jgi:hypothetical protein
MGKGGLALAQDGKALRARKRGRIADLVRTGVRSGVRTGRLCVRYRRFRRAADDATGVNRRGEMIAHQRIERVLPLLQITRDGIDGPLVGIGAGGLVAHFLLLGAHGPFGHRYRGLTPQHRTHRGDPQQKCGKDDGGDGQLESGGNAHEADMAACAHENFPLRSHCRDACDDAGFFRQ